MDGMEEALAREKPDMVLVHGDTTTTFAGALAAFYRQIPIGHIEAGLRTHQKYSPYPEEINRRLTGALADIHFAPTILSKKNLEEENLDENIYVTGNTVIDAFLSVIKNDFRFHNDALNHMDFKNRRVILLTCHRRENYGQPMQNIMRAVRATAENFPDITVVYPVHLSPVVREAAYGILAGIPNVKLIEPLDAVDMHRLIAKSYMVMTDSGGIQEEAPALGKPVLVLRQETERPEAVEAGTVLLAGTAREDIERLAAELLTDENKYETMAHAVNPYGDGRACPRIADAILYSFGLSERAPEEFCP
jgi:UDP-N-acetylglucosamine 2-epimerase (non-hydrolysing)